MKPDWPDGALKGESFWLRPKTFLQQTQTGNAGMTVISVGNRLVIDNISLDFNEILILR